MEAMRKLSDIDPSDRAVVERLFGQRLDPNADAILILQTVQDGPSQPVESVAEVPSWCNVLEGLSDEDLAEFDAAVNEPVRLARPN